MKPCKSINSQSFLFLKPFLEAQYSFPLHFQVYDHFQFRTQDWSCFGNSYSCTVGSKHFPCWTPWVTVCTFMGFSVFLCSITSIKNEKASAVQSKRDEWFNHSVCYYLYNFQEQDPWSPVFFYSTWDTLMDKYLLDGFGFGNRCLESRTWRILQVPQGALRLDLNNCSLKIYVTFINSVQQRWCWYLWYKLTENPSCY